MGDYEKRFNGRESSRDFMLETKPLLSSLQMSELLPGGITYTIPKLPRPRIPSMWETQAKLYMQGLKVQHDELLESLKDDEQLSMICWHGHEKLEVISISMPSNNVVAMHCVDEKGTTIQVTGHMNSLNFSFRVNRIEPPAVRKPIGFEMPKTK